MLSDEDVARVCKSGRELIGIPWHAQGRSWFGIDCVGVPVTAFRNAGFTVDEGTPDYQRLDSRRMVMTLERHGEKLATDVKPQAADIVVWAAADQETHVGLLVDGANGLNVIHCPLMGRVVETRFDPNRGKVRGYYRWRS